MYCYMIGPPSASFRDLVEILDQISFFTQINCYGLNPQHNDSYPPFLRTLRFMGVSKAFQQAHTHVFFLSSCVSLWMSLECRSPSVEIITEVRVAHYL